MSVNKEELRLLCLMNSGWRLSRSKVLVREAWLIKKEWCQTMRKDVEISTVNALLGKGIISLTKSDDYTESFGISAKGVGVLGDVV